MSCLPHLAVFVSEIQVGGQARRETFKLLPLQTPLRGGNPRADADSAWQQLPLRVRKSVVQTVGVDITTIIIPYCIPFSFFILCSNGVRSLDHTMDTFPYEDYPPSLTPEQEEYILGTIKDWSIQQGLAVRPPPSFVPEGIDKSGVLATTAPVTFFPSPFPKECFEQGQLLQTTYNELYAAISNDEEWIEDVMKG